MRPTILEFWGSYGFPSGTPARVSLTDIFRKSGSVRFRSSSPVIAAPGEIERLHFRGGGFPVREASLGYLGRSGGVPKLLHGTKCFHQLTIAGFQEVVNKVSQRTCFFATSSDFPPLFSHFCSHGCHGHKDRFL